MPKKKSVATPADKKIAAKKVAAKSKVVKKPAVAAKSKIKAKPAKVAVLMKKATPKSKKAGKQPARKVTIPVGAKRPAKKIAIKKPLKAASKPVSKPRKAVAKKVAKPSAKKIIKVVKKPVSKAVVKKVAKKNPAPKSAAKKSPVVSPALKSAPAFIKPVVGKAKKEPKQVRAPRLRTTPLSQKNPVPKRKPRKASGLKRYAKVLRRALAVKKPAGPQLESLLRPEYSESGRVSKDAERLLGVSRKVH